MLLQSPSAELIVVLFASALMQMFLSPRRQYSGVYHLLVLVLLYGDRGWFGGLFIQTFCSVLSLFFGAGDIAKEGK